MSNQRSERSSQQQDVNASPSADPPGDALLGSALAGMAINFTAFAGELDEAAQQFRSVQAINGGREGCMWALRAVINFCDNAGLSRESRDPLTQLFLALQSADIGAVDPILKVAPRPYAPLLTEAERRQRGCLAAAMEALIRGGFKPDDAARWVADRSRKMISRSRVKTAPWKAVKSWRATAMGGNVKQDQDANAFRAACEVLDKGSAIGPQGAEVMLKMAAVQGTIQETPPLT